MIALQVSKLYSFPNFLEMQLVVTINHLNRSRKVFTISGQYYQFYFFQLAIPNSLGRCVGNVAWGL